MCESCGVSTALYQRMRSLLASASWSALYRMHGMDPAELGLEDPSPAQKEFITQTLTVWCRAHPGRPRSREDFIRWCDRREVELRREREAAELAGC
jgi:hypothetical protein